MTRLVRPLDEDELRTILQEIRAELLIGLGLRKELLARGEDFEKILRASVETAFLEGDEQFVLGLPPRTRVQRVRLFLLSSAAQGSWSSGKRSSGGSERRMAPCRMRTGR
jgi:hypothetical protein